jgi:hypothetical protein
MPVQDKPVAATSGGPAPIAVFDIPGISEAAYSASMVELMTIIFKYTNRLKN